MKRTLLTAALVLVAVVLAGCGTAVPDVKGMTVDSLGGQLLEYRGSQLLN